MGLPGSMQPSPKSYATVVSLPAAFGLLDLHRFYVGKIRTGILQLLTLGGFGIWTLVDFVMAVTGKLEAGRGLPIEAAA